jgi:hypothetical protein
MEGLVTAYSGTALTVNVDLTSAAASAAALILPNHLSGLALANDVTTPFTVLDVGPGAAASDDNLAMMVLSAAGFKKNCNAAWVAGSGNGALDTGTALAVSTWYHVFLIERPDTLAVDVLISINVSAPTLPANFTRKRRIGSIKTDTSAHILGFWQLGDQFLWDLPPTDYSNIGTVTTTTAYQITVPPGIKVIAIVSSFMGTPSGGQMVFWAGDVTGGNGWSLSQSGAAPPYAVGEFQVRTTTSQRINAQCSVANGSGFYIVTRGWFDYRGK